MVSYSPVFELGSRVDVVAVPLAQDGGEKHHLLSCLVTRRLFRCAGSIPMAGASVTLLQALVVGDGKIPSLQIDVNSRVLPHRTCQWGDMKRVVSLCAGMGVLEHGVKALGYSVTAAVDHCEPLLGMHQNAHNVPTICGDVGSHDVWTKLWSMDAVPGIMVAGVSCQPYSSLGDGRAGEDERSASLPGVLAATFFLQSPLLVLECVPPAKDSSFVQEQLQRFIQATGFYKQEIVINLCSVFPARRNRWWCVLSSPVIGRIDLRDSPGTFTLAQVRQA